MVQLAAQLTKSKASVEKMRDILQKQGTAKRRSCVWENPSQRQFTRLTGFPEARQVSSQTQVGGQQNGGRSADILPRCRQDM